MRSTITTVLALLILVLVTGCGQPLTRAEFQSYHPWSTEIVIDKPTDDNGQIATLVYPDAIPRMDFNAPHSVRYEHGIHVLKVRAADDIVIERRWEISLPLAR
jgi:hypothetical protein